MEVMIDATVIMPSLAMQSKGVRISRKTCYHDPSLSDVVSFLSYPIVSYRIAPVQLFNFIKQYVNVVAAVGSSVRNEYVDLRRCICDTHYAKLIVDSLSTYLTYLFKRRRN